MRTKKGFTLIEIIVVIAIIGVLAAILVPAISGYIRKAKLRSADNAASVIMKAANSALTGLEEIDCVFTGDMAFHHHVGEDYTDPVIPVSNAADTLYSYMELYFDNVVGTEFAVYIHDGVCIASSAASGVWYGTQPTVYTAKTYGRDVAKPRDAKEALDDAVVKYKQYYPGVLGNNGGAQDPDPANG